MPVNNNSFSNIIYDLYYLFRRSNNNNIKFSNIAPKS